jgi:integrase
MATKRRGSGEGGLWKETRTRRLTSGELVEYVLWVGGLEAERDPATGRRRRVRVTARTKAEAMRKMRLERDRVDSGQVPEDPSMTVEQFLRLWTTEVLVHRVDTSTFVSYRGLINKHLIPGLGRVRLRDLRAEHVDRLLRAKADAGMARSSVGRLRSILTDALTHAERRQLVPRNAGGLSIMPAIPGSGEQRALTEAERDRFVATAMAFDPAKVDEDGRVPHRLAALMAVMFHVGLRPEEGTGLLWDDLDAAARTLMVSGSIKVVPRVTGSGYDLVRGGVKKSTAGERTIRLSAFLVALIEDHRARQAAERERAGAYWVEMGLMFPSEVGTPIDPSNLRRAFSAVAAAAGIGGPITPYTARHTAASLFIDAGASLDQVADLLGDDLRTVVLHYRHRVRPVVEIAGG